MESNRQVANKPFLILSYFITELEENLKTETPGKDAQDKGEAGEDKGRSRCISREYIHYYYYC